MKRKERLYDAITNVDDELIEEAGRPARRHRRVWPAWVAACLVVALCVGAVAVWQPASPSQPDSGPAPQGSAEPVQSSADYRTYALSMPEYPQTVVYPLTEDGLDYDPDDYTAWSEARLARIRLSCRSSGLDAFLSQSIPAVLRTEQNENRVYAPLNVYLALAMLAEMTDGNSQQQLLGVLGEAELKSLRAQCWNLWNANYCDDGTVTSLLGSSVWLNEDVSFRQETLDALSENYYASVLRGEMGSAELDAALHDWINAQTNDLLGEQTQNLHLDAETVMALVTTIYYAARWSNSFSEAATAPAIFHAPQGDVTCDFMNETRSGCYYQGEQFSAVRKSLSNSGSMYFILPDEGVEPNALLEDAEWMAFLLDAESWEQRTENVQIELSVPKFDVSSQLELSDTLQALGVTDIFDESIADFSRLTEETGGAVSKILHGARVKIDEEGVEAAAYTMVAYEGALLPEGHVSFVLDRPFLFAICNEQGLPLFVGVVQQPVA